MRRDRYAENKGKINAQKRMAYARRKTGNMTTKEFAAYKRELAARKGLKQITLQKEEYAAVMREMNTNLSVEDRKHALVTKPIGDYVYTIVNMVKINLSETAKGVIPKLRKYYNDDDYVLGVIVNAKTDDNLNIISDFIDYAERIEDDIISDHN
jgi:hypothetical protein